MSMKTHVHGYIMSCRVDEKNDVGLKCRIVQADVFKEK